MKFVTPIISENRGFESIEISDILSSDISVEIKSDTVYIIYSRYIFSDCGYDGDEIKISNIYFDRDIAIEYFLQQKDYVWSQWDNWGKETYYMRIYKLDDLSKYEEASFYQGRPRIGDKVLYTTKEIQKILEDNK